MLLLENNGMFLELSFDDLAVIEGGGVLSGVTDFVKGSWDTLYYSGRDFGRSVVNALMP